MPVEDQGQGGCQCGALRYRLSGPTVTHYVCHCRECRKQSASAFGITVQVARKDVVLLRGTPAYWERPTDSGRTLRCAFCPTCGSRVWHDAPTDIRYLYLKGGSLDEPPDLTDALHIWTSRKLPGVVIPKGARRFQGEPA